LSLILTELSEKCGPRQLGLDVAGMMEKLTFLSLAD
jgi:hypothetical protein